MADCVQVVFGLGELWLTGPTITLGLDAPLALSIAGLTQAKHLNVAHLVFNLFPIINLVMDGQTMFQAQGLTHRFSLKCYTDCTEIIRICFVRKTICLQMLVLVKFLAATQMLFLRTCHSFSNASYVHGHMEASYFNFHVIMKITFTRHFTKF